MKNYDHFILYHRPGHTTVRVGDLKTHRLRMKNLRRAENGLPPKTSYSEI